MTGTIEPLPCPDSPLRPLDPRWKLATLALVAISTTALQHLAPALAAFLAAAILGWVACLPRRWTLIRLGILTLTLVPFLLVLPLIHRGGPVWSLGPVDVSQDGVQAALLLIFKTIALTLLILVLLTSSPLPDTLKAAQSLRVPRLLIVLALLAYRYVFVLTAELARLRVALRVRGYRNRADLHSYRTAGHVAGVLLLRGYERAERVGHAMRCRGFDGRFRSLNDFRTRGIDGAFFALGLAIAAGLLAWDRMGTL